MGASRTVGQEHGTELGHVSGSGGWTVPVLGFSGAEGQVSGFLEHRRAQVVSWLETHGAVLLRGLPLSGGSQFASAVRTLTPNDAEFEEESSPRRGLGGPVMTSTDYPNDYPIQLHNEYSYSAAWPLRLFFFSKVAAEAGGETPIANSRNVLRRLSERTRAKFERLGVGYRRRFSPHLGVDWRRAFLTDDPEEVLRKCRRLGIEARWNGEDLQTWQTSDAIVRHPVTGEQTWFNHAFFFNVRSLEPIEVRETLLLEDDESLSTNTYYGNGDPIEADTIEELREAYAAESLRFRWEEGDLLAIDNMLCSHGRSPFRGRREVMVIMTDKVLRRASER